MLLDLNALGVLDLSGLRHVYPEDAVLELGGHLAFIDVVDVEGTAHGAYGALPADVVPLRVLLLVGLVLPSGNGEIVVLVVEGDILLLHPRQVGSELVGISHVPHIHLEGGGAEVIEAREVVVEEGLVEEIEEAAETVLILCQTLAGTKRY